MKESFFVLDRISVQIDPEEVIRQLGYPQPDCVSPGLTEIVEQETHQASRLVEPRGAYVAPDGPRQQGLALFAGAERIVLALATIGRAVELRAKELIKTHQPARGLIVDAVGTVAAEQTADSVERTVRRHFTNCGWKVSRRYAPGYCGWDVAAQKDVFACFPDTLGIELTDACLMVPEKSLSFACLLSKDGDFSAIKVAKCSECEQKRCPYRDQPHKVL